jgi:hypothetical protein
MPSLASSLEAAKSQPPLWSCLSPKKRSTQLGFASFRLLGVCAVDDDTDNSIGANGRKEKSTGWVERSHPCECLRFTISTELSFEFEERSQLRLRCWKKYVKT